MNNIVLDDLEALNTEQDVSIASKGEVTIQKFEDFKPNRKTRRKLNRMDRNSKEEARKTAIRENIRDTKLEGRLIQRKKIEERRAKKLQK